MPDGVDRLRVAAQAVVGGQAVVGDRVRGLDDEHAALVHVRGIGGEEVRQQLLALLRILRPLELDRLVAIIARPGREQPVQWAIRSSCSAWTAGPAEIRYAVAVAMNTWIQMVSADELAALEEQPTGINRLDKPPEQSCSSYFACTIN